VVVEVVLVGALELGSIVLVKVEVVLPVVVVLLLLVVVVDSWHGTQCVQKSTFSHTQAQVMTEDTCRHC
jgi:hypothetical protein